MSGEALAGIIILISLVVALIVLTVIASWKIFKKMGRPGWTVLVPVYKTVVMLEALHMPLWLVVLMVVPFAGLAVWILMCVRLARAFGKGGWFTVGLIFLPFIFYPILGFGSAPYQESNVASGITEAVRWTMIGTAAIGAVIWGSVFLDAIAGGTGGLSVLSGGSGYATDGRHVYQYDTVIPGADPYSFTPLNDYYALDNRAVFYAGVRMPRAEASSFELLGDYGYARDAYSGYYDGVRITDDAQAFTVPGYLYAKDSHVVYYAGEVLAGADAATFTVPDTKDYYALDDHAVYYDGEVVEGADAASFRMELGSLGNLPYDARDKNHYYYYGVDAHNYADMYQ